MSNRKLHVFTLLQDIHGRIEGIKNADTRLPPNLNSARLPEDFVFEGNGELKGQSGLYTWEGYYIVEHFTAPLTKGVQADQYERCMDLLSLHEDAYMALLEGDTEGWMLDYGVESGYRVEIDRSREFEPSGARTDMTWYTGLGPTPTYYGFTYGIPVRVQWGNSLIGEIN